jgi:predicted ATPase/DNA-binding SARP family transcriptional activator
VRYRLLGPVEVVAPDGAVAVGGRQQRLLLAALLLEAGRPVATDRLCELLWATSPPAHPSAALRSQIARLRRTLAAVGGEVHLDATGYRLDVGPDEVDVDRFERLVAAAAHVSPEAAVAFLDDALALWRGPAIAEFNDCDFAQPVAVRLDERRDAARERRAELLLALDRTADAVAALRQLVTEHPERERARGLLMEALYRAGQHTDALDEYHRWREHLGTERGLEPSPALKGLEADILRHTLASQAQHSGRGVPSSATLPRPTSRFVGRDEELGVVAALLELARVVTFTGTGGVGKTRLALEVAQRVAGGYPDGVVFCDLGSVVSGSEVVRSIAAAVGLREAGRQPLDVQLVEHLAQRRSLLLLDNCDHAVDAAAAVTRKLTQYTDRIDVLATSRERLRVDGEHVNPVAPLSYLGDHPPAVALFMDRATAVNPHFLVSPSDAESVRAICARLDGLPLAIEMAAAQISALTLKDLAEGLAHRFSLLDTGQQGSDRHRSLRAAVEWSYRRLGPLEQHVFDGLCVLVGAFDLSAGGAVVGGQSETPEFPGVVARLVGQSLITYDDHRPAAPYRILETLRSYGVERLRDRGALTAAHERHARWAIGLAERAAAGLASSDEGAWVQRLDRHFDDLRSAHRWLVGHDADGALRLADTLHPYALWHGRSEVFRWAEVASATSVTSPLRAAVLASACAGAWMRGDLDAAERASRAAVSAASDLATPSARRPVEQLGELALLGGDASRAVSMFDQSYRLSLDAGDLLQAVWDRGSAALALGYDGRTPDAQPLADEALALAERTGSPSGQAFAHFVVGELGVGAGSSQALAHLRAAIELARTVDNEFVAGLAEVTMATTAATSGNIPTAIDHFQAVIANWQRASAWTSQWVTLRNLVGLLARTDALDDAAVLYGAVTAAATGAPPYGRDRALLDAVHRRLADEMTPDQLQRHITIGQQLHSDDVITFALVALERVRVSAALAPGR